MAELRPKLMKLIKMIGGTAGVMNKITENDPSITLDGVVTDDMADVACTMGLRIAPHVEFVQSKCGRTAEETQKL